MHHNNRQCAYVWNLRKDSLKADYVIRCGEQADTFVLRDGQVHLAESEEIEASRHWLGNEADRRTSNGRGT